MTTFQLVTIPLLLAMLIATAAAMSRRRITPRLGLFWMMIWSGAAVFIAFPDLSSIIANALGIGRGADLVLYLSILFMLGGFFGVYLRFRRLDEQLTRIVRHLAIRDAGEPPQQ
ncbi:MAG TPA: DUF2304 domain-containing protein [Thermoanaerobaculia bacterium]|nr:DUF2304 domain-containing protein [Thermoanaerobaculia bacterium]